MYKIAVDTLVIIWEDSSKNEASRGKITRNNGCIHEKEEEDVFGRDMSQQCTSAKAVLARV